MGFGQANYGDIEVSKWIFVEQELDRLKVLRIFHKVSADAKEKLAAQADQIRDQADQAQEQADKIRKLEALLYEVHTPSTPSDTIVNVLQFVSSDASSTPNDLISRIPYPEHRARQHGRAQTDSEDVTHGKGSTHQSEIEYKTTDVLNLNVSIPNEPTKRTELTEPTDFATSLSLAVRDHPPKSDNLLPKHVSEMVEPEAKIAVAKAEISVAEAKFAAAKAELDGAKAELDGAKAELDGAKAEVDAAKIKLAGATIAVVNRDDRPTIWLPALFFDLCFCNHDFLNAGYYDSASEFSICSLLDWL